MPVRVKQGQQERSLLMAIWQEGDPCLIPDTDLVAFISAQGRPLGVYFRQTLPRIPEIRGEHVDIWGPRRTRYTIFPTREQLDRLEQFATGEQLEGLLRGTGAPTRPTAPRPTTGVPSGTSSPVPEHLRGLSLGPVRED